MRKLFIIKWCFIMMNGIQDNDHKREDEIRSIIREHATIVLAVSERLALIQ